MTTAPLSPRTERARVILRWMLAAAYLFAGIAHIHAPQAFLSITPAWVPFPEHIVLFTGVCEIAGSIALFVPRLRWLAGVMLALYAVCVYPANVKHAMDYLAGINHAPGLWYHVPRLLFQPVIVWWALFAGGVIDWPFGRRAALAGETR